MTTSSRTSPLTVNKESWVCSWYDEHGKRRWKSFGNTRRVGRREAERRYARFLADWHASEGVRSPGSAEELSVADLVERFLAHAREYYRKPSGRRTSHASNMDHATRELVALFGDQDANAVRATDLRRVRDLMVKHDLTRKTINERIGRVRQVFKWGVGQDLVAPDVLQRLQAVEPLKLGRGGAREGEGRRTVAEADLEAVLPHLPAPVAAMARLQWLTGMRPGEAMAMRLCDIDRSGDGVWVYTPAEHKTEHHGKTRHVELGPRAQRAIQPFLGRGARAHLFDPRDAVAAMHASRGGTGGRRPRRYAKHRGRYTAGAYRQAIHRACDAAGVERWCPYDLRHTAATRLRAEHGEEVARVMLGHSSISTTQLYGEVDRSRARAVAAEVG